LLRLVDNKKRQQKAQKGRKIFIVLLMQLVCQSTLVLKPGARAAWICIVEDIHEAAIGAMHNVAVNRKTNHVLIWQLRCNKYIDSERPGWPFRIGYVMRLTTGQKSLTVTAHRCSDPRGKISETASLATKMGLDSALCRLNLYRLYNLYSIYVSSWTPSCSTDAIDNGQANCVIVQTQFCIQVEQSNIKTYFCCPNKKRLEHRHTARTLHVNFVIGCGQLDSNHLNT